MSLRSPYHGDFAMLKDGNAWRYECCKCELFGLDDAFAGLLSGAGTVISGLFGASNQEKAQDFNARQAAQAYANQVQFRRTAYQDTMADMRDAGLNPILAYQRGPTGGSSVPMGTSGVGATMPDLGGAVNTAMSHMRLKTELENMKETNYNIKADTMRKTAETTAATEEAARIAADRKLKEQTLPVLIAEAAKSKTDLEFWNSPAGRVARLLGLGGQEAGKAISPLTDAVRAGSSGLRSFTDRWKALEDRGY